MKGSIPKFAGIAAAAVLFLLVGVLYMNEEDFYSNLPMSKSSMPPGKTVLMSSDETGSPGNMNIYLMESEKGNKLSEGTFYNISKALSNANVPFKVMKPEGTAELKADPYTMLILTGEDTARWNVEEIERFVQNGGRLFTANRFSDSEWNRMLGIKSENGYDDDVRGVSFSDDFFKGYPDLDDGSDYMANSMLNAELSPKAETYITAEGLPLLWTHDWGKGRVVNWNGTGLQEKITRGIVVQAIGLGFPAFASGVAGEKIMFIDDFPAPVAKREADSIQQEYGMSYEQFLKNVWWPDMKKISENHGFPYTGAMIGTYMDKPGISGRELKRMAEKDLLSYGRQLLSVNGEIALHGYNHESLVIKEEPISPDFGYRYWNSQQEMETSLRELRTVQEDLFPEESFRSYVPPSNLLNRTGIQALAATMPDLEVLSSLYTGDPSNGSLIQEFGYDKEFKHLYHFPRMNSGYTFNRENQFQLADAAANMGVFSHFIHPDDVLDEERSGSSGWMEMKREYRRMQEFLSRHYPYMKGYTQIDAKKRITAFHDGKWTIRYKADELEIHGYQVPSPSMFYVRVEKGRMLETGDYSFGKIKMQQPGLYLLTLEKPNAEVKWKEAVK
ncbi:DUF2194 domain-containing protein [Bacillus mangrovi]|uniref:DUF2194 domain-containing protein n=1 Tax=Metabacillus mangrovi TaxID=1491830 RepID=A0A7X2V3L4_9BACI|nr:DUF2194 domain-containing protein [Metabacillus mangrovi]MTH52812.1 DUF2194 domain-containing protein [Metabacillus mangrovi]